MNATTFNKFGQEVVIALCVAAFTGAAMSGRAQETNNDPIYSPEIRPLFEAMSIGGISISGSVREVSGLVVTGVTAHVNIFSFYEQNPVEYDQPVNESFAIACSTCSAVEITFSRDGYYDSGCSAVYEAQITSYDTNSGLIETDMSVLTTNVTIILQKIGQSAVLSTGAGRLVFHNGGGADVLDFQNLEGEMASVPNLDGTGSLPLHGMYLIAATNDAGEIQADTDGFPVNARVVMTAANSDGFNVCPVGDLDRETMLQRMVRAPTDGYVREISLASPNDEVLFYCKANNLYGKGYLSAPPIMGEGDDSVFVFFEVKMRTDDGQNSGRLVFYDGGGGDVLDFQNLEGEMTSASNLFETGSLPLHGMYLIAATNDTGGILVDTNGFPANARVVMTDTNSDGFIVCPLGDLDREIKLQQMVEVPTNGYVGEISLASPNEEVLFYYRANNVYGKGYFSAPPIKGEGDDSIFVFFEMRTGEGQNVETAY